MQFRIALYTFSYLVNTILKRPPPGSIISRYSVLLSRLLSELIMCWQRPQPEMILVESAFLITQKHCNNLKQECWQHKFTCKQEEIYFFKAIHPQFAGRMMYYSILYESLLSCPDCHEAAKTFWGKELDRYDRFCNRYERVVEYLDENRTDQDERYFLMRGDRTTSVTEKTQFMCCSETAIWSASAAMCFAEKSYRQFVLSKIACSSEEEDVSKAS